MPPGRERTVYRASVRGARAAGQAYTRGARRIQGFILDEFSERLAPRMTEVARNFAPHDHGRLERGLKAKVTSRGGRVVVELLSTARSDSGYPYTDVTRFGHRVAWIYPVKARALRLPAPGRGPGFRFYARVRGYRPKSDWVEDAAGGWQIELDRAADRLGRKIDTRLLR